MLNFAVKIGNQKKITLHFQGNIFKGKDNLPRPQGEGSWHSIKT